MSQFCGWFDNDEIRAGSRRDSMSQRHRERMPASSRELQCAGGALYGAVPGTSLHQEANAEIAFGISGNPRWPAGDLAQTADSAGNAVALAEAYRRFGDDTARQIGGSFAFAVADRRRGLLLLAIDRMGICSLYYGRSPDGVAGFGTSLATLFANPALPRRVSEQSVYRYFYFHVVPSPATIFEAVAKLEPAHQVRITADGVATAPYWSPPARSPGGRHREREYLQALRDQIRNAVQRCEPDRQTGAFLSGGLDSSTVCGIANESTTDRLPAFTIGFDQQGFDEMSYARIAARHFGLEHVEYYITPDDVASAFDLLSTSYDEPFGNSSAIPAFFCARQASERGLSRLLAGDGGDELFAGNERYATQMLFDIYDRTPGAVKRLLLDPLARVLPEERPVILRKIRRYIEQARVPMPDRLQTYNFLEMFDPRIVFEPHYLDKLDIDLPRAEMRDWYGRSDGHGLLDRMLFFDWKLTLADNDIRKVNQMCSAAGIEVVYPLLDTDLVDFSTTMPDRLKLRYSTLRYGFKNAFRDFLPQEILGKQKHGFGLPFGEWLKSAPSLREKILPLIAAFTGRGILAESFIDEMRIRHESEHAGYFGNMLWLIAVLENWLRAKSA